MTKQSSPTLARSIRGKRIFLSFARDDHKLAGLLFRLLATLTNDASLIFKADSLGSGIPPGSDWRKTILVELQTAKALVGLVTPRSIASRWLWIEGGIVWSREPSIVRLLLTPDITPGQMSPFDHIQAQVLKHELRAHVKKALEDVVGLMGVSPVWNANANRLLRELLLAANASTTPTAPSSAVAAERDRDESTLHELLLNLPTTVMDQFLADLHGGYILGDIFHYFEGFRGVVSGSDFHIFDATLRERVDRFAKAWNSSLSFGDYVVELPRSFKFRLPSAHELGSHQRWKSLVARFDHVANDVGDTYSELIKYIKTSFPAFDLRETTALAIKRRNDYYNDLLDLEEKPPNSRPAQPSTPPKSGATRPTKGRRK